MMRRSVQVTYLFVAPLLFGFFFAAREVVLILLTEKWLPAVPFIQIFCIVFFLLPIQNINMTSIKSLGYSNITLKLEVAKKVIEAVILVVSFLINVYAVAWGIVVYNLICIVINLSPSKRLVDYGLGEQLKDILPTTLAALLMGGAVFACELLPLSSIRILVIQITGGSIIYYVMCKILHLEGFEYISTYLKGIMKG